MSSRQHSSKKTDKPQKYTISQPRAAVMPIYTKTVLSNGVRVLTEEVPHVQSFALGIWVNTGSRDEIPSQHGIAHFIEHLVFRGTEKRTARQIANYVESVGGYVNAFTTKEHTCFYVRALSKHFNKVCALLADAVLHSLFRAQDVEKERAIILEEMKSYDDEPEEVIFDYLDKVMFGKHPMAHPIVGTPHSVSSISMDDITTFHQQHYGSNTIIVSVAGNIPHGVVCSAVEQYMSDISPVALWQRRVPKQRAQQSLVLHKPIQQAHLALGAMAPGASSNDFFTLAVLNTFFGEGMSSRLNQIIRERHGIAYTANSSVADMKDFCVLSLYAAMEPGNLARTERLIERELEVLRTREVGKAELQRAKEQVKSQLIMSFESMSGRMHTLAKSELYVGEYDDIDHTLAIVDAISPDAISTLVHTWLAPEHWHKVVLLPSGE